MRIFFSFTLLLIFFQGGMAYAQNIVRGQVFTGGSGDPLPGVLVTLLERGDSSLVTYRIADIQGKFELILPDSIGPFFLKCSLLGFQELYLSLLEEDVNQPLRILLHQKDIVLGEVLVESFTPAIVKNDTTTYTIDTYRQDGERTLADVLSKMPNVRVEESGDVFFKNKKIDKVLLDGDPLIGENYRSAIKSLDPSVLNEVQAIENYSENPLLRGIEKGDQTVLNLLVKENKKSLFFGTVGLGLGPNAYNGVANLYSYQKKIKAYILAGANNMGIKRNETSQENLSEEPSRFYSNLKIPLALGIERLFPQNLKTTYENINQERLGSLNISADLSSKTKLTSNFSLGRDLNSYNRLNRTSFFIKDPFETAQLDTFFRKPTYLENRLLMDISLNPNSNLKFYQWIKSAKVFFNHNLIFESQEISEQLFQQMDQDKIVISHGLDYTKKLNENSALIILGTQQYRRFSETLIASLSKSVEWENLFPWLTDNNLNQVMNQESNTFSAQGKWLYGKNKFKTENRLELNIINYIFKLSQTGAEAFEENQVELKLVNPAIFQSFSVEKRKLNLNYKHRLERQSITINSDSQTKFIWQSTFSALYQFNSENKMSASVDYSMQPLINSWLMNNPYFMDFRSVFQGITQPLWNEQRQINLGYFFSDMYEWRIGFSINGFWVSNPTLWTLAELELRPEFVFSRLGRTSANDTKGLMIKTDKFVYPIRGTIKLNLNYWASQFEEKVNGLDRLSSSVSTSLEYSYFSALKGGFNFELKGYFQRNDLNITQNQEKNSSRFLTSSHSLTLKGKFQKVNTKVIFENFGIDGRQFHFLHARVDYDFSQRLSFVLNARNILNTTSYRMVFFTPNQFQESIYTLLGRQVTLGFNWIF